MGADSFRHWQPRYAAVGLPLFPCRGKRPAVRNYLSIGPAASARFVPRFAEADAFGVALKRSRLCVVDVDSPDERALADALGRHGDTPFIVRSGSGHFQAWYSGGDGKRHIRPDPSRPIDILGDGFVVVPPSQGARGRYEIIRGGLDDVLTLPPISGCQFSDSNTYTSLLPSPGAMGARQGERNIRLWRFLMIQARYCDDLDALLDVAHTAAATFEGEMSPEEVEKTARSAWRYEEAGKNWVGLGGRPAPPPTLPEGLLFANPDAYLLLSVLRHHHPARPTFLVANAMHEVMPGRWSRQRFASARAFLVEQGHLVEERSASQQRPAVYRWPA